MREEIANLVYPVLTHGVRLRKRLAENDEGPDFATAQNELQGLLQSANQAQRWADFGGDAPVGASIRARQSDQFLGIRYALVCWLDEIFILDSPWQDQWSERSLEVDLYACRDRAWKFWEQADRAATRPSTDALEVFFLCVMLGFRGDKGNNPADLQKWCERIKAQLDMGQGAEFTLPPEGQPRTYVPILAGERRLQRMQYVAGVTFVILIPALEILLGLILAR
ncbi:MAG TPA: DotU family type IV/VI secretion system protein [Gemmataceae bacterium]|jgi:type VI secretion system protein ImpK|nr:DotU family type IV/VI secretion system protein [Gemmataceae bacterium]